MSTDWSDDDAHDPVSVFRAPGYPPPAHPAEAGLFVRQESMLGHDQARLADARVLIVGAGGLGSWTALGLVRSGIRHLTLVDHDRFDRTNAHRQLMFERDLGRGKARSVAHSLVDHMIAGGDITAIDLPSEDAVELVAIPTDLALFLVDNNGCRLSGARFARRRRIPAVFAMLSQDGMRLHAFLQGPDPSDPCLSCALPNVDPDSAAPCAAATITSCFAAATVSMFFAHRAPMGWPDPAAAFNWRECDVAGGEHSRTGRVIQRSDCPVCRDH